MADDNKNLILAIVLSTIAMYVTLNSQGGVSLSSIVQAIARTSFAVVLIVELINYFVDGGSKLWTNKEGIYFTAILMVAITLLFGVFPSMSNKTLLVGLTPIVGAMATLYICLPFELAVKNTILHKVVLLSGFFVIWIICIATSYAMGSNIPIHVTPFGW